MYTLLRIGFYSNFIDLYNFIHKSFATTAPTVPEEGGDSHGYEQGFNLGFGPTVWGKYPWFALYLQKQDRVL